MTLPRLLSVDDIQARLQRIFPEGTPQRNYCTRMIAARTVFTMLYIGAIEGENQWLAPKHVYCMSDAQAAQQTDDVRLAYAIAATAPRYRSIGTRWYSDNTREPIRDETLRDGLSPVGAIILRSGIPTTSSRGRYALSADFTALFSPDLDGTNLDAAIALWQQTHLSASGLARIHLNQLRVALSQDRVTVRFPNGETRLMEAGPSSVISKAVVEEFATRFLGDPAVLWLSESGNKVVARDDALARHIGIHIDAAVLLPDIILVDLGSIEPLFVFVEVVASDGSITEERREALLAIATTAGFAVRQAAFVTAYADRAAQAFTRSVAALAWQSFIWFMSEPDHIISLEGSSIATGRRLSSLLNR